MAGHPVVMQVTMIESLLVLYSTDCTSSEAVREREGGRGGRDRDRDRDRERDREREREYYS